MAAIFQGIFFFMLGIALFLYDYRAWHTGTIRTGYPPRESGRAASEYVVTRFATPVQFYLAFIFYGVVGILLIIFALRLLTGHAEPLSLAILWYK